MAQINDNYLKLKAGYLFPEIGKRIREFATANPDAQLIKLGIGDVVLPLAPSVIAALHKGVDEMASADSFRGYGPEQGYDFLRNAIVENEFADTDIKADEIIVSDGSKCDSGNIQEIFGSDCVIAVSDPVYPVYVDTNVMAGRSGAAKDGRYQGFVYMPLTAENRFSPQLPDEHVDLIYLCSPNNPTGEAMRREDLKTWVDFARNNDAIILFDAAYERFISEPDIPHSIFEIEGARECAIEFRSFSKTAGFTGVRCAFTVIPMGLTGKALTGERINIRDLWLRRHTTKFNGVSYPVQVGAASIYSEQGKQEIAERITYYMENARIIREALSAQGMTTFGGVNAPYVWLKTPDISSWEFFDKLLNESHIVGTPGAGFGPAGEGYFRLSAFATRQNVNAAVQRLHSL